jgi:NhaA family Na+:H+ antiporter
MSLFIGALAFPAHPDAVEAAKLGTLAGSCLSAIAGWTVLRFASPLDFAAEERAEAREIFGEDQQRPFESPTLAQELAGTDPASRMTRD